MRLERKLGFVVAIALAVAVCTPAPTWGQFTQYTQPGSVSPRQLKSQRERLDEEAAEARWHLGALRVDPWLAVRDLTWIDNPGGQVNGTSPQSDLSATVGAGLAAFLHSGPKVVWTAYTLPEYVWWKEDTDRRRLNGRYGLGMFAFFNRLTFQGTAKRTERVAILSAEVPEQANTRQDELAASGALRLGFSTSVFAEVGTASTRNLLNAAERRTGPAFQLLDRDEDRVRAGLRYEPRERWRFEVGEEWTQADFVHPERDLSNSGTAPLVGVTYSGPKLSVNARAELRSLKPRAGSEFVPVDTTTASVQVAVEGNRLSPAVYARRTLSFSIVEGYSSFATDVYGVSFGLEVGRRANFRTFAELGTSDYTRLSPDVPDRQRRPLFGRRRAHLPARAEHRARARRRAQRVRLEPARRRPLDHLDPRRADLRHRRPELDLRRGRRPPGGGQGRRAQWRS